MPEFDQDGYQGLWLPGTRLDGAAGVVVVVKRRFDVDADLGLCVAAAQTEPVLLTPESSNEQDPARGVVTRAAEAALEKPRVDVMVLGDAHAPEGKAVPEFQVGIRVGDRLDRRLNIVGPREARARKTGKKKKGKKGELDTPAPIQVSFSKPRSISSLPLTYEYAYGGRALFRVGCADVPVPEPPEEPAEAPPAPQDVTPEKTQEPEAPADRPPPPEEDPEGGETLVLPDTAVEPSEEVAHRSSQEAEPGLTMKIPLEEVEPPAPLKKVSEEETAPLDQEEEEIDDGRARIPYPANPVGRGFCVTPEAEVVRGLTLPSIEDPDAPLSPEALVKDLAQLDLTELPPAAGFAPYPRGWYPRAGFAGVLPGDLPAAQEARAALLDTYDEEDEDQAAARALVEGSEIPVMRPDWYQEAHPTLQLNGLLGNEEIALENLTPEGTLVFSLAGRHPLATVDLGGGQGPGAVHLVPDMLTVDLREPGTPGVELVWRGWAPVDHPGTLDEIGPVDVRLETLEQEDWMARVRRGDDEPEPGGTTLPLDQPLASGEESEETYKASLEGADESPPEPHAGPTLVIERTAEPGSGEQES